MAARDFRHTRRKLFLCAIFGLILLCGLLRMRAGRGEHLYGFIAMLRADTLAMTGLALDVNNLNLRLQVKVCYDDPRFISVNCETIPTGLGDGAGHGFSYTIPTHAAGGILPRDGRQHQIYAKIVSDANPGAGDVAMDASPWPFRYVAGVPGPMYTARTESAPSRLTGAQVAIFANARDPYSVGTSGTTVCTVNGTAIKDDGVAGYYAKRRAIPCANVRVISTAVEQYVTLAQFRTDIQPVLDTAPASIQAIAVAWVEPVAVTPAAGRLYANAITSMMATGGKLQVPHMAYTMRGVCGGGSYELANPYFNSTSAAPYTDYGIRPAMMLVGETCAGCAANNISPWKASVEAAKATIDAAVAATGTNPAGGVAAWAWTQDTGHSWMAQTASPMLAGAALSPWVTTKLLGSQAQPTSSTISERNILMYVQAAGRWPNGNESWLPGAGIGYASNSSSGLLPEDGVNGQAPAAWFLSRGAVASFGSVAEPCVDQNRKYPMMELAVPNYAQGQTVLESLWKATYYPWGGIFIGDPLAAPYRFTKPL